MRSDVSRRRIHAGGDAERRHRRCSASLSPESSWETQTVARAGETALSPERYPTPDSPSEEEGGPWGKHGFPHAHLTRILWPTWSVVGFAFGFSASSLALVVPKRAAIEPKVSPF